MPKENSEVYPTFFTCVVFLASHHRVSHRGGAWGAPPILRFFFERPPTKTDAPHGAPPPPLKMKPSHLENKHPQLKHETPFHEVIPRKSAINNNLKSS